MAPRKLAEHGGARARKSPSEKRADPLRDSSAHAFLIEQPKPRAERPQDRRSGWTDAPAMRPPLERLLESIRETGDELQWVQRGSLEVSARSHDLVTQVGRAERSGRHIREVLELQADLARQQAETAALIARIAGILEALVADGGVEAGATEHARNAKAVSDTDRVLIGLLVVVLILTLVLAALVYVLASGDLFG